MNSNVAPESRSEVENLDDIDPVCRVERAHQFVQDDESWIGDERTRDRDSLRLAPRNLTGNRGRISASRATVARRAATRSPISSRPSLPAISRNSARDRALGSRLCSGS